METNGSRSSRRLSWPLARRGLVFEFATSRDVASPPGQRRALWVFHRRLLALAFVLSTRAAHEVRENIVYLALFVLSGIACWASPLSCFHFGIESARGRFGKRNDAAVIAVVAHGSVCSPVYGREHWRRRLDLADVLFVGRWRRQAVCIMGPSLKSHARIHRHHRRSGPGKWNTACRFADRDWIDSWEGRRRQLGVGCPDCG